MRIANPIYDVVFKYLLDDEKVARIVLSALLGQEVVELAFMPTEARTEARPPEGGDILVLRMDFAATVKLEDGSRKLVLVEIQKARSAWDVMRFRRYLGTAYAEENNVFRDGEGRLQPLPILTIYFLGEGLHGCDLPVLKINRHCLDPASGEVVRVEDPFVDALTHDSIVIQINRLKGRRRTDLERLLMLFDQGSASMADPHLLDILEANFPERYREVLRRLVRAGAEPQLRTQMDLEDDVVRAFKDDARRISDLSRSLREKEQVLGEKERVIDEKERVIDEKERVIGEKERVIGEKDRAIDEKDRIIEALRRELGKS